MKLRLKVLISIFCVLFVFCTYMTVSHIVDKDLHKNSSIYNAIEYLYHMNEEDENTSVNTSIVCESSFEELVCSTTDVSVEVEGKQPVIIFDYPMFTERSLGFSRYNEFDFVEDTFVTTKDDEFAPVFYKYKHLFTPEQIFLLSLIDRCLNYESILKQCRKMSDNQWYRSMNKTYEYYIEIYYLKLRWSIDGEEHISMIFESELMNQQFTEHLSYLDLINKRFEGHYFKEYEYYGICHWRNFEIVRTLSYEQEFIMDLCNFACDGDGPITQIRVDFYKKYENSMDRIRWFEFNYLLCSERGKALLSELNDSEYADFGCCDSACLYEILHGLRD